MGNLQTHARSRARVRRARERILFKFVFNFAGRNPNNDLIYVGPVYSSRPKEN